MGFLDDVFNPKKKNGNNKKPNKSGSINNENRLANFGKSIQKNFNQATGNQPNTFHGQGQSLGGSEPGDVIEIILPHPGPLGVRVEKRSNNSASAIVNQVVPNSQAEAAGLKRGDVICFAGSNGQNEVQFDMFLQIAKSTQRPIHLEARRFQESKKKAASSSVMASAASSTSAGGGRGNGNGLSADAEARRKAMIDAAVAREKAHKKKTKTIKYVTKTTTLLNKQQLAEQAAANRNNNNSSTGDKLKPQTEASRKAAAAAKRDEQNLANELGYNPYESAKSTAGQARSATVTTQHGEVNAAGSSSGNTSIPVVAPPTNPTSVAAVQVEDYPLPEEFVEALLTIISNGDKDASKAGLKIARTLIVNATTKGQQQDEGAGAKFRKVRLENAKIKKALVDVPGNIQLMLSVGFQLVECDENNESLLMFPSPSPPLIGYNEPLWLSTALRKMEQQEKLL